MSSASEVAIEFKEVPVVRNARDMHEAAGRLAVAHFACVFDLEPSYAERLQRQFPFRTQEPALRGLQQALEIVMPAALWECGDVRLRDAQAPDFGLHFDPAPPNVVAVHYHSTKPADGGFEATFATPTAQYKPDEHEAYLTDLLRAAKTDPKLVAPDSFRRVSVPAGGALAFSRAHPDGLPQLHDFRTTTDTRLSALWTLSAEIFQPAATI